MEQAVDDIDEVTSGPIVLVAHSIGDAVSPGIAARLSDRVVHLVHIAAVAAADRTLPLALRATDDRSALARIDSLNFGCAPTSWAGVAPAMRRTFIQPLRDRLYPAEAQARLAAAMRADEVITIDAGHNVARSWPAPLAVLLRDITARYE